MSETVGPYRVVEELGRGATARALLAVDSRTGAKVVLKVLQEVSSPVHQKRFAREVKALEQLTHPCIVRVVASGVEAGRPWYAMEHLESRPLDRVLRQRWVAEGASVSPAEARQALGDVASALACAHAHKTVHRDLKPSNVLVDAGFSAMLIDFGIARMLAEEITKLTRTGDFVGTPAYAAPEQFEREVADYRTDVYAFGLLAYEVMTGKLPFAELAPMEMIRKRSHDPIAPPGSLNPVVPPGLDRVVLHCLEPDPDARYQTMGDVIADMELAFTGGKPRAQPAARRPAPAVAAVRAPSPASPARVALVAAATALAGGLFVWRAFDAPAAPDRRQPDVSTSASPGRVDRLFVRPEETRASLAFRSPSPAVASVRLHAPGRDWEIRPGKGEPATEHRLLLERLKPATEYRFQLLLSQPDGTRSETDEQIFRTKGEK